jgi:hypothetical protein
VVRTPEGDQRDGTGGIIFTCPAGSRAIARYADVILAPVAAGTFNGNLQIYVLMSENPQTGFFMMKDFWGNKFRLSWEGHCVLNAGESLGIYATDDVPQLFFHVSGAIMPIE